MQRPQVKIAFCLADAACRIAAAEAATQDAAVSGVVRDAQGVAQMGALVQVMAKTRLAGHGVHRPSWALSDPPSVPGKYEVKASAALFVPAMRGNLQLRSGAQAVVNLTLNTLFESAAWLPAERRKADEPSDDWKWTLRSAANRPILRLVEDGDSVMVSSSMTEQPTKSVERARGAVRRGMVALAPTDFITFSFSTASWMTGPMSSCVLTTVLRADPLPVGLRQRSLRAMRRQIGFAGAARTLVSYQSHPEMVGSGHVTGLDAMQVASAQRMKIGDIADLEAGGSSMSSVRPAMRLRLVPL